MASTQIRRNGSGKLKPSLSLTSGGTDFLSATRMRLLEALDARGSIAAAARAAGLTYKAAWDNISAINNLAERPVVTRKKGGRGGGGSELTEFGRELISLYQRVAAAQAKTAASLQNHSGQSKAGLSTLRVMGLRTSARNQYLGRVERIRQGAVNSEVTIDLGDGLHITSIITRQSVRELGLRVGQSAVALIKATFVLLSLSPSLRISARNVLRGTVSGIRKGSVNAEVHLDLPGHRSLVATVTIESLRDLALRRGVTCQAVIKASHVLLAVAD